MNILVIRLSSLGDVVLTALLVRRLRDRFPEALIDFVTLAANLPLLEAMPELDGRFAFGNEQFEEYDVVIDLQNNLRSRRRTRQLHAGRIIRYHRPRVNRFFRIHFPGSRKNLETPAPVARQYLAILKSLGVTDDGSIPKLSPPAEWIASAESMLVENGLTTDNLVLIAVGGRHKTKIWPREKWLALIQQAYDKGFTQFAIIGSIADVLAAEFIIKSVPYPVITFAGKTDVAQLTGLIASAKLLICGDSGPMHIAAAVGTSVVAIFGPTVQEFGFAPLTANARVVEVLGLDCRPCHPHGPEKCPKSHFRCMLEITPDVVLQNALELTAPPGTRR